MPRIPKVNTCGHADRPHFSKNMCSACYQADRYAKGLIKSEWQKNYQSKPEVRARIAKIQAERRAAGLDDQTESLKAYAASPAGKAVQKRYKSKPEVKARLAEQKRNREAKRREEKNRDTFERMKESAND